MLLVFHSEAAQDVLMLSDHVKPVLQAAGRDCANGVPERGAFSAEQLPAAIAGIEQAIAQEAQPPDDEDEDAPRQPAMGKAVSFRQRAWPLLDMLRQAQAKNKSVMWEPASNW